MSEHPLVAPAKAPTTRGWRNWYRALVDHDTIAGHFARAGDVFPGHTIYASKDLAETAARDWLAFINEAAAEIGDEEQLYEILDAREDSDNG